MPRGRYLAIIPARGGSKRIPGKNLRLLRGRPLLWYTIAAARAARCLTATVISTDSPTIARYAARQGVDPQGLRPVSLARDGSPVAGAIADALGRFEQGHPRVDAVVLLQPTSPLRSGADIDRAIRAFERHAADTVTSVRPAREHPWWTWTPAGGMLRPWHTLAKMAAARSEVPPACVENGAVMVIRRSLAVRGRLYGRRVVPLFMDEVASIDIDTPLDLAWAEFVMANRRRYA